MAEETKEATEGGEGKNLAPTSPLKRTMPRSQSSYRDFALGSIWRQGSSGTSSRHRALMHVAENLHDVTADEVLETLRDLTAAVDERVAGVSGHEHTLQHVAAQALGQDTLSAIISRDTGAAAQLEMVATRDTKAFGRAIGREHPQICAVVLALLQPDTGSAVLMGLPAKLKSEVMFRIANLKAVPSDILDEIADVVGRDLKQSELSGPVPIDGMDSAVKLLKATPSVEEGSKLSTSAMWSWPKRPKSNVRFRRYQQPAGSRNPAHPRGGWTAVGTCSKGQPTSSRNKYCPTCRVVRP